jgi:hypothetical protein
MEATAMAYLLSRPARPHGPRFGFLILSAVVLVATTAYALVLNGGLPA